MNPKLLIIFSSLHDALEIASNKIQTQTRNAVCVFNGRHLTRHLRCLFDKRNVVCPLSCPLIMLIEGFHYTGAVIIGLSRSLGRSLSSNKILSVNFSTLSRKVSALGSTRNLTGVNSVMYKDFKSGSVGAQKGNSE